MSRVTVCTGWHPAGYDLYGRNFIETFCRHWPAAVRLLAYTEDIIPLPAREQMNSRVGAWPVPLWECNGVTDFIDRHKNNPAHCGKVMVEGWKPREIEEGYSFRFDAVKFCKQLFIPEHAAQSLPNGDILVWLDADVVSHADVPAGFVESLLDDADLSYLGRGEKHSEIGFWAVRLNPLSREFLASLACMYRSDQVFELREWHSAFVFDHCRNLFQEAGGITRDLTPGGRGHVWFQCDLGKYTDHLKGDRKLKGRSGERKG